MRKRWTLLVLTLPAALLWACNRPVVRTVDIAVPQLRTPVAATLVKETLAPFDAGMILEVETDTERHMARVRYDSTRLAIKNIEHAIAGGGFDANGLPGDAARRAALPEDLR